PYHPQSGLEDGGVDMVRKITPNSGGWGKRPGTLHHLRAFERSASRALMSLPASTTLWRDKTILKLYEPLTRRPLPPAILTAFRTAITQLVDLEIPTVPEPTTGTRPPIEAVSHRSRLRALLTFKAHAGRL